MGAKWVKLGQLHGDGWKFNFEFEHTVVYENGIAVLTHRNL